MVLTSREQAGGFFVWLDYHCMHYGRSTWEHLGQDNWSLDVGKAPLALRSLVACFRMFCSAVGEIDRNTLITVTILVVHIVV